MNARTPPPASVKTAEEPAAELKGPPLVSMDSAIFREVRVALKARLGDVTVTVEELLALRNGSVLKLDRTMSELVDLYLNDAVVARGEIVAVDDNFGVRILEIAPLA